MAIRFKYDATGVVIPQNASNRKYGQALVLQQKRFEDEQKLLAQQQQMLNRQRQGMQQPLMMNAQQQAADRQQLGQRQGLANLNAGFGANVAPAAFPVPNAQQPAGNAAQGMDLRQQALARLNKAQADAGVLNPQDMVPGQQALAGLNASQRFGAAPEAGYPTSQALMERQQSAEMEQQMAAQMQAQERAAFEEARKAGEYDPVTAAEIQKTYADATKTDMSKDLDAAQKAEWHAENNAKRSKLLENRNPNPSPSEQASRNLLYYDPRVGDYVDKFEPGVGMTTIDPANKRQWEDPVPKPQAPAPTIPASYEEHIGMDPKQAAKEFAAKKEELRVKAEDAGKPYDDEDKLRADASAALKGDYDHILGLFAATKQQSQPATPPATTPAPPTGMQDLEPSYNADGTTGEQIEQAIESKLFPQGDPPSAAQATQPPAVPQAAQQPAMSPEQSAQPQTVPPPMDMIAEANKTFESGTPEQKAMLRQKMKSPDSMSSLEAQAKAGNADAYKAISALTAEVSPLESVAGAIIAAKKDGKGAVAELRSRKAAGMLDDASYTEAIVANSGKTAKQNYEMFSGNAPGKYGTGSNTGTQVVRQSAALNSLWDEMGMYDSRSYVRAFQKEPTIEDVITHVAMKDNMPRKDAEEYVYNQILIRSYAKEVQQDFEGKLTKDRPKDREKKQDAKRDTWTSKTK
jgi:hypothetical protein